MIKLLANWNMNRIFRGLLEAISRSLLVVIMDGASASFSRATISKAVFYHGRSEITLTIWA